MLRLLLFILMLLEPHPQWLGSHPQWLGSYCRNGWSRTGNGCSRTRNTTFLPVPYNGPGQGITNEDEGDVYMEDKRLEVVLLPPPPYSILLPLMEQFCPYILILLYRGVGRRNSSSLWSGCVFTNRKTDYFGTGIKLVADINHKDWNMPSNVLLKLC